MWEIPNIFNPQHPIYLVFSDITRDGPEDEIRYKKCVDCYTASKCPSRYPIKKRSLAASASEQPLKQRKVKHEINVPEMGGPI